MVKRKFKNVGISTVFVLVGLCCLMMFALALSVEMIVEAFVQLLVAIGCIAAAIKIFHQSNIQ